MERLWIQNARLLTEQGLQDGCLLCRDGKIEAVGNIPRPGDAQAVDAGHAILAPGFLDLHTHGAVNVDVNSGDAQGLVEIGNFFASHGVTGWLCSILTDTEEQTLRCIHAAREAMQASSGARLLGIHLEGPTLSGKYAGAMPPHLLQQGDLSLIRRYQEAAEGAIRSMTIAPEVPGALEVIRALSDEMVISLGHSEATYDQAIAAIDAGAKSITHTFNAMRLFHQHEPAIMGAALERDVYCEAICDGRHLHPGSVRMLLAIKGSHRMVPITDSIMATGLPDGDYRLGVNEITVVDGDALLKGKSVRAGSTLTMDRALRNLLSFTGRPMEDVLPMLSQTPAALLGDSHLGAIASGYDADFVLLDDAGNILQTYIQGKPHNI